MVKVPGHSLMESGAAFAAPECTKDDCFVFYRQRVSPPDTVAGFGHGACECGARGPHGDSQRGRRRWFEEHRDEVLASMAAAKATAA